MKKIDILNSKLKKFLIEINQIFSIGAILNAERLKIKFNK